MVSIFRRVAIPVLLVALCLVPRANADPLEEAAIRAGKESPKLVKLGNLYLESQRLDEARDAFRAALADPSIRNVALLGLARIDMVAGKFQKAKSACRALKRKDSSGLGEICKGDLWMSADRSSRAIVEFREGIKKGAVALGELGLAETLRNQGDYADALTAYDEAAKAGAGYRATLGTGLVLEAQKKKNEALAAFQSALQAQPASSEAHYRVGRLLKPGPKAVALLRTATSLRSDWPRGLVALGRVLAATGDHSGALEAFKKAEKAGGAKGEASFGQAEALRALGRPKEARAALEKTIEAVPSHSAALMMLSRFYMEKNEVDNALAVLERARAAVPEDVSVYVATGEIYHQIGRDTTARSFLKHALTLDPKASRAHVLLGDIDCSRSLYEDGKKSYRAALAGHMAELTLSQIQRKIAACKRKEKI